MTTKSYIFDGIVLAEAALATCGPALNKLSKQVDKNGPLLIPTVSRTAGVFMYLPGAGLRSKLRGAATNLSMRALKQGDRRLLSLADAQLLRVGGIKQSGAEAAVTHAEYEQMLRENPVLSCFGASTPWVTGKLSVGHLYCENPIATGGLQPMVIDGVRRDIMRGNPEISQYLEPEATSDYERSIQKIKASSAHKREIAGLEATIRRESDAARKKELREQLDALKKRADAVSTVSAQMPLGGYQAIPAGELLGSKLRLVNASTLDLGCVLCALDEFAMAPLLGAHVSHGCGEISGKWSVRIAGGDVIGEVRLEPYIGLEMDDPTGALAAAMDEFRAFVLTDEFNPYANESILATAAEVDGD